MPRGKTTTTKADIKKPARKKAQENVLLEETGSDSPRTNRLNSMIKKYGLMLVAFLIVIGIFWVISKYLVVAWVNKKPITRFEYYSALEKKDGEAIRNQLIQQKLLTDEAVKKGVRITDQEVADRIKQIETQQGGAQALDQALEFNGLSRTDLNGIIKQQITKERVFGENVNITDADVNKYVEEHKAELPETVDDKIKSQIKEELKLQQVTTNYNNWLKNELNSKNVIRI